MDELLDEVEGYVDAGYRRVKLKIQPGWDVEPVAAVRERSARHPAAGRREPGVQPRPHRPPARLDDFDLLLIEQPLHEDDLLGQPSSPSGCPRRCASTSRSSRSRRPSRHRVRRCEIVNIKAGRVGGYLEAKAIHDLCRGRGMPVWCGGMLETGLGRAANLALGVAARVHPARRHQRVRPVLHPGRHEPFGLVDGRIAVPTGPGLGVEPIPDVLEDLTVWQDRLA